MHDLPARGFWEVPPDEDNHQREDRADQVGDPPAPRRDDVVEQEQLRIDGLLSFVEDVVAVLRSLFSPA
ncbi:MAG: hypothetical protein WBF20_22015 [Trebonia sp.]|uniref:hypothetical protein n=1 Tax=Trebonia sp. TaxID=2767075 RepID=UPI003C7611BC